MKTSSPSIFIEKDAEGHIFISQSLTSDDLLVLNEDQALKLAYRLMSYARGQGPLEKISIEESKK